METDVIGAVNKAKKSKQEAKGNNPMVAKSSEVSTEKEDNTGDMIKLATTAMGGGGSSKGSSATSSAGDALMMSGNPHAMAAGGVLKVMSAARDRKDQQIKEEQQRRMNIAKLVSQLGNGIGNMGMA